MWRLAGIERDVFLYAVPQVHIRDFFVQAGLAANRLDGTLNVTVDVRNLLSADDRPACASG